MFDLVSRWASRFAVLAVSLALASCITADGIFFAAADFATPKAVTGDWASVPAESTDKDEEVQYTRFTPAENGSYRAQPIDAAGNVAIGEEALDFGLVALGGTSYIMVSSDDDGEKKSTFLGMDVKEDKLTTYLFGVTDNPAEQAALDAALKGAGLVADPAREYETHLTGNVTKEKIKALFQSLMTNPAKYGADVTVYQKAP